MRTVFKILLVPVWLVLVMLKLALRLAAGATAFVLTISGGLLLVYDLFLLIIGLGSKELMLQLLMIGALFIAVPLRTVGIEKFSRKHCKTGTAS